MRGPNTVVAGHRTEAGVLSSEVRTRTSLLQSENHESKKLCVFEGNAAAASTTLDMVGYFQIVFSNSNQINRKVIKCNQTMIESIEFFHLFQDSISIRLYSTIEFQSFDYLSIAFD